MLLSPREQEQRLQRLRDEKFFVSYSEHDRLSPQLLAMIKAALSTSGLCLSLQIPGQTHRQPASAYRCTFAVDPAERLPHQ